MIHHFLPDYHFCRTSSLFVLVFLWFSGAPVFASVDGGMVQVSDGSHSRALINGEISDGSDREFKALFSEQDTLTVNLRIQVDPVDVGQERALYLAMAYNGRWGRKTPRAGRWTRWDGDFSRLRAFARTKLLSEQVIGVISSQALAPGEYQFVAGYQLANGAIVYNATPLAFTVFDSGKAGLQRYHSDSMLETYLKEAMQAGGNPWPYDSVLDFAPSPPGAAGDVSSTNLQEAGVDEDDTIKTDGEYLYLLSNCDDPMQFNNCVRVSTIQENPPQSNEISRLPLKQDFSTDGLYLLAGRGEGQQDILVTLGSGSEFGPMPSPWLDWFAPWAWYATSTDIVFYDVSNPANAVEKSWLQLDGALISSRRIGDVLYVVSRFAPTLNDYLLYPGSQTEEQQNQLLLQQTPLSTLMPKISSSSGLDKPLVDSRHCFLPAATRDIAPDPTIISILAIPVDAPEQFRSVCVTGPTETIYVSRENLYLATTRNAYEYTFDPVAPIIYQDNHRTQVHKFALDNTQLDYRGSGEVVGQLGWEMDKKPFRMGEHEGVLRVATSLGSTWNTTSSTSVTLLEESPDSNVLRQTGRLDNLGKPGERLYAARFLGNRGYLVTFRNIDPLYVLDLSNPYEPFAAGELEIEGYSDYLHPLGDDFLLGIGKDAFVDEQETAWYQGVKLTLFDVSDPFNPFDVNSIVLGKRGTQSDLLDDHHALSYLPADVQGRSGRIAIPVQLHDTEPGYSNFDPTEPSVFYDWTHTGLYVFDIDTGTAPGISIAGSLVVDQLPGSHQHFFNTDRSVLKGSSIHYVRGGGVHSDFIERANQSALFSLSNHLLLQH